MVGRIKKGGESQRWVPGQYSIGELNNSNQQCKTYWNGAAGGTASLGYSNQIVVDGRAHDHAGLTKVLYQ